MPILSCDTPKNDLLADILSHPTEGTIWESFLRMKFDRRKRMLHHQSNNPPIDQWRNVRTDKQNRRAHSHLLLYSSLSYFPGLPLRLVRDFPSLTHGIAPLPPASSLAFVQTTADGSISKMFQKSHKYSGGWKNEVSFFKSGYARMDLSNDIP